MIASAQKHPATVVQDYVDGVLSGAIVTGRLQRLAVERYVDDLKNANARGFKFDRTTATRACMFFPLVCRHSIGEWDGERFTLTPTQMFCSWNIFGWKVADTGYRRFARAYVSTARKSGKTTWLSGVALYAETADGADGQECEPGAEVYIAATKEDQAKIMYNEAVRMVEASPALTKRIRIQKAKPRLLDKSSAGRIVPLGADSPFSGLNPHCVLIDELHEWCERHRPFLGTMTSGGGSRRQPLQVIITTAGDDHSQIWIEEYEHAKSVVESVATGNIVDDREFVFICEIDEDDDPFEEKNWIKANPNYPITPKEDYLRTQAALARSMPSAYNKFVRFHGNKRTSSDERVMTPEMWKLNDKPLMIAPRDECHGAFDLGRSDDWAAATLCFPKLGEDGNVNHYELLSRSFCCKDGRFKVDQEPFRSWIRQGLLNCCDGNQIDFNEVREWIYQWHDLYSVKSWAHDPTFAGDCAQTIKNDRGIECFRFTQSHNFYNVPFRRMVEAEVPAGRFWHGGDPVLSWQAGNLEKDVNSKDHWMPKKKAKRYKIDGMVAAIMAFSECLYEQQQSYYYASNKLEIG